MKLNITATDYILTEKGIDLSIPLSPNPDNVLAWYCEPIKIEPVITEQFIGDVKQGGSVNFRNVTLNLHGNGTHTECVGHISHEDYTLNQCLKEFHFNALVLSITPEKKFNSEYNCDDFVITGEILQKAFLKTQTQANPKALIIRTLANHESKKNQNYSNTNPAYIDTDAIAFINELGVDHLLIDLPSVDRENDNGKLLAHHLFWNYPQNPQLHKTITELIYVPDQIQDGYYLLNIQITSLESDASPSKIMLFEIFRETN